MTGLWPSGRRAGCPGVRGRGWALSASSTCGWRRDVGGDRHAAEDVAQDLFFSAWRSIDRFRGPAMKSAKGQVSEIIDLMVQRIRGQPEAQGLSIELTRAAKYLVVERATTR